MIKKRVERPKSMHTSHIFIRTENIQKDSRTTFIIPLRHAFIYYIYSCVHRAIQCESIHKGALVRWWPSHCSGHLLHSPCVLDLSPTLRENEIAWICPNVCGWTYIYLSIYHYRKTYVHSLNRVSTMHSFIWLPCMGRMSRVVLPSLWPRSTAHSCRKRLFTIYIYIRPGCRTNFPNVH